MCGSSPRERFVNYLLDSGVLRIAENAAILHIAPGEPSLVKRFGEASGRYEPVDLSPELYDVPLMRRLDLMEPIGSASFDLVYASHVLEHVPNDIVALANIFDALKPGGEVWLIVPLWDKPTEDGHQGLSATQREKRFGQWDHVRQYGLDIVQRIITAGFEVEKIESFGCSADLVHKYGLGEILFRAKKPCT